MEFETNVVAVSLGMWVIVVAMIWKMQFIEGGSPWYIKLIFSIVMLPIIYGIVNRMSD